MVWWLSQKRDEDEDDARKESGKQINDIVMREMPNMDSKSFVRENGNYIDGAVIFPKQ